MRYVTSFNANPRYYRHVPLIIDHVRNYLKEDISILFLDDSAFLDEGLKEFWSTIQPYIDDKTITVKPAPVGIGIADATQLSRFWFAGTFQSDEVVTVLDIDMYPIMKSHFIEENDDYKLLYHHFNFIRHGDQGLIPACYHSAPSKLFKKIYNKDFLDLNEFLSYAQKVTVTRGYNFDECYATSMLDAYQVLHKHLTMLVNHINSPTQRLDTVFVTRNPNWRELNLRNIIDFHVPRSFSMEDIKDALNLLRGQNEC